MSDRFDKQNERQNIIDAIEETQRQLEQQKQKLIQGGQLSQITTDAGVLRQGGFYALSSGQHPLDSDACGVFMDAEGIDFGDGNPVNIGGVNLGLLKFGMRNLDGAGIFASGKGIIDNEGLKLEGLQYVIRQTAEAGGETRIGQLEMFVPDGGTTPAWGITFSEPDGTNLGTNFDAETGDLTGWTATTETQGTWSASSVNPSSGTYCFAFSGSPATAVINGVLTSNRIAVTAGKYYAFSGDWAVQAWPAIIWYATIKAEIKWYNDPAAGSLIRTDVVLSGSSNHVTGWATYPDMRQAPVGAQSCAIVLTVNSGSYSITGDYSITFDNIALSEIGISYRAYFDDTGFHTGSEPDHFTLWGDEMTTTVNVAMNVSTSQPYNAYWAAAAADANNGDEFSWKLHCKAGAYTVSVLGATAGTAGKVDWYLDGTLVKSGQDWYTASAGFGVIKTFSMTVPWGGNHTLKAKLNGTNGTDYRFPVTKIWG